MKTDRSLRQTNFALDFQKLRPQKTPRSFTERTQDPRTTKNAFNRIKDIRRGIVNRTLQEEIKPENDYFQLLHDKERKRFNVEEYDGVDEYYDKSTIMNRIYKQGFRHPEYYSTPLKFEHKEAPDEKTIKEEHMLKIAPWICELENANAEVTHLLGGTNNEINYVWVK